LKTLIKTLAVILVLAVIAAPQNPLGSISGQITDPNGATVKNVLVRLTNLDTGIILELTTDGSGQFRASIPTGRYDMAVIAQGYKVFSQRNVLVALGQSQPIQITVRTPNTDEGIKASGALGGGGAVSGGFSPVKLTWNAWTEPAASSPGFSPLQFVAPENKLYSLFLDLGAFAYSDGAGFYSRGVASKVREWLLQSKAPSVNLKLVIIPDENFFEPLAENERAPALSIDLDQLRSVLQTGIRVPRDPMKILKETPKPRFSFGRASVNFRTRLREGSGSIAVALWADGIMPIDELSIPICVAANALRAKKCDAKSPVHDSLSGIDPMRAATQQHEFAMRPDAALHFIELDSATTVGIFRDNSWPDGKFETWNLSRSTKSTIDYLRQSLLQAFDNATNDEELIPVGKALYNLLFPIDGARTARSAFEKFVRERSDRSDTANPASIFVRILTANRDDPPFLIPLGLIVTDFNGQKDFLGFHFRIQTPLPMQDYQPDMKCIANWVVMAPSANASGIPEELSTARGRFSDWYDQWQFKPITGISSFIDWAGEDVSESVPMSLFILAHQDSNSLYFANSPRLQSENIERSFLTPSVAVVNGCSTGAPGSSAIVQKLNSRGISTIIATAGKVDKRLAGDFFKVLANFMTSRPAGEEYPLGAAHFLTLRSLRNMAPEPDGARYGAKVLAYDLLGNSNVRVCSPPRKAR
jgi:hypothetical protein